METAGTSAPAKTLPAVKLLLSQLLLTKPIKGKGSRTFRIGDIVFQRVWLQGYAKNVSGASFELVDDSGIASVSVDASGLDASEALPGSCQDAVVKEGDYVLLIGPLVRRVSKDVQHTDGRKPTATLLVRAHKLKRFRDGKRAALWRQEVDFLHEHVYPKIVETQTQAPTQGL